MLNKFLPLLKFKRLAQPCYKMFSNQVTEDLYVRMNLYFPNQKKKQYILTQNQSVQEVEKVLQDDAGFSAVNFQIANQEVKEKNAIKFVDLALNNNVSLQIDNKSYTFDFDMNGDAIYFNNSKFDPHFAKLEIPLQDSEVLNNYINIYNKTLQQLYPNKQTYSLEEMQNTVLVSLKEYVEKNNPVNIEQKEKALQGLLANLEEEEKELKNLELQAEKKGYQFIKFLIFITVVQWGILFYMTYVTHGWDVTEPISYLIGLAIETAGIWYYIRYRAKLGQSILFTRRFKLNKQKIFAKKSTNPEKQLDFLKNKIKLLQNKVTYGKVNN